MTTSALDVRFDDDLVGRIERRKGTLRFAYDEAWRSRPDATPLSLSMPLAARQHAHRAVDAYLWGLLPDNDRVIQRWGRDFAVTTSHPLGLLAHVGQDLPGAMRIVDPDAAGPGPVTTVDWLTTDEVGDLLTEVRTDHTAWLGVDRAGRWSLAGAQPKIALLCDDGRWGRPRGRAATNRILKPAITGFDDHDINEHLSLVAASHLGLRAARSTVTTFGAERAIVVERYDRTGGDGTWLRVHQEDICQALGIHPAHKHQSDGGPSPEAVIALLRSHIPGADRADADVDAFVDALIFNWIIAAPDAHAKNYSVLLSGAQVRLAPLYDIASALPYDGVHAPKVRLAMKIGPYYLQSAIRTRAWEAFAVQARLDPERVIGRARQLCENAADAYATAAVELAEVGIDEPMASRLVDRVATHAEDCRRRLM